MSTSEQITRAVAENSYIEKLARVGYLAHGLIYIIIGGLAAGLATGMGGALTDPPGAIEALRKQALGGFAVLLTAAGLAGYALWRLIQAVSDPDEQGTSLKGLAVRIARVVSGAGYGTLAVFAARLSFGPVRGDSGNLNWAAQLISEPTGAVLGTMVALVLFGVALEDVRKAYTARFGERLKGGQMTVVQRVCSRCAGIWGFAARAVVLSFAGGYLLRGVWYSNPGEIKGFAGVLGSILALPHGNWVLGAVGAGLAAYGMFMLLAGRYRRHPY